MKNPLELTTALTFGAFLALIMLLGKILQVWLGDMGVLALAIVSGIADVDAITLSLARMSNENLILPIAATGIVIAASVNSLIKGVIAAAIGGRDVGFRAGLPLFATAIVGPITAWLWIWQLNSI